MKIKRTDFSSFSYTQYLSFFNILKASDQFYRKKGLGLDPSSLEALEILDYMGENDRNNSLILMGLLKKFGWPCSTDPEKSFIAWLVVWHNRHEDGVIADFKPFIELAYKNKCINESHYIQLLPKAD